MLYFDRHFQEALLVSHTLWQPSGKVGSLLAFHNLFTWYHLFQREILGYDAKNMSLEVKRPEF